jgi:hypothetical protein
MLLVVQGSLSAKLNTGKGAFRHRRKHRVPQRFSSVLYQQANQYIRIGNTDRLMFGYLGGHVGMSLTYLQNASDTSGPAGDSRMPRWVVISAVLSHGIAALPEHPICCCTMVSMKLHLASTWQCFDSTKLRRPTSKCASPPSASRRGVALLPRQSRLEDRPDCTTGTPPPMFPYRMPIYTAAEQQLKYPRLDILAAR